MKAATPALSTLNIKVLSLPIEITTNHESFRREFCELTSALATPANGEPPVVRFQVMKKKRCLQIESAGRIIYRLTRDYHLCPFLMDEIRASCYGHVKDYLLVHAGAVVKNGRAILLPGKSESGKTTLTLGLTNHGYKYLTDEVSAIHHETTEVVPFQRPIYVWRWSRPLRQEVSKSFKTYRYRGEGQRWQYIVPQDGAVIPGDARCKVDWIIFPKYVPKSKVVLKPIGGARAAVALLQRCWNAQLFPDRGLKILTGLVRRARCYTLEMGDLEEACKLIESTCRGESA